MRKDKLGSRYRELFWPRINDLNEAHKVSLYGWHVALLSASITVLVISWNLFNPSNTLLNVGYEGFLDVALTLLIGFGIRKKLKVAAVLGVLFFIAQKVALISEGTTGFSFTTILFLLFYLNAARGVFAWHRFMTELDGNHDGRQWKSLVFGGVFCCACMALVGYGLSYEDSGATILLPREISKVEFNSLQGNHVILSERDVLALIPYSREQIINGGMVLERKHFVFYTIDERGEPKRVPIHYSRIKSVRLKKEGSFIEFPSYELVVFLGGKEQPIEFQLPNDSGRDKLMISMLNEKINEWH